MTGDGSDFSSDAVSIYQRIPWRKLGGALGVLVLIAAVVPFLIFAFPQTVGADHGYVVISGSMQPTISQGSVVIVEDAPVEAIGTDDVIAFTRGTGGKPITHRVVEVVRRDGQRTFRTKGDANANPDRDLVIPGQNADVEGRVMKSGAVSSSFRLLVT